jgi:RNA polymerase sigma-70 factor (ECF subfamily)
MPPPVYPLQATVQATLASQEELTRYRMELTGYCYRMLGSAFDADDAVQETLVRAWRSLDRFEGRASLRAWLYRIATNACLDILRGRQRRALPVDITAPSTAEATLGAPLPEAVWVQPVPDGRVLPTGADPADLATMRDTVRLAFITALQQLPPRQRAVLILRDVLKMTSDEAAEQLDASVASVNGMLRRARAKLATIGEPNSHKTRLDDEQDALLARYVDAFERYDVDALLVLLHEDATLSMPPFTLWLRGRIEIARWLSRAVNPCPNSRLVRVSANGSPAFAQYHAPVDGGHGGLHRAFALQVLTLNESRISRIDFFLTPSLFALFDQPIELGPPALTSASQAPPP